MLKLHACFGKTINIRGLYCDVILTASDHLAQNDSGAPTDCSSKKLSWTSLSCHKIVSRVASSFFDRIFLSKYTYDKMNVDENVEGVLFSSDDEDRELLQITLHEISAHLLQASINFAYTGNVAIVANALKRA